MRWVFCIALLASTLSLVLASTDYYKVLDVDRSASLRDIKKQYRKLSKKYHPDKNKENEDVFLKVSQAFEVLSDEEKRRVYDQHGEEGLRRLQQGGGASNSPFDLFSRFFGGSQAQQERKGPSMQVEVQVDMKDVYTGKSFDVRLFSLSRTYTHDVEGHQFDIRAKRICHHCDGSGANHPSDIVTCPHCDGRGIVLVRHQIAPGMFTQMQQHCQHCRGQGKTVRKLCPICKGHRVVEQTTTLALNVDRGLPDDSEIVFEGEADESPDWTAGDVVVKVRVQNEQGGFTRKGPHLYYKQVIGVDEALLGFEKKIMSLDGHDMIIKRTEVTQPGHVQIVKEEGLPHYHMSGANICLLARQPDATLTIREKTGFGNLYIEYSVVMPETLDATTRSKLEDIFQRPRHAEL